MRMQPLDTCVPMLDGFLVPWMRNTVPLRYMARAPSGLPGPPAMKRGRYGWGWSLSGGGMQYGHSDLRSIVFVPDQVKPSRPTPMPYLMALPPPSTKYR